MPTTIKIAPPKISHAMLTALRSFSRNRVLTLHCSKIAGGTSTMEALRRRDLVSGIAQYQLTRSGAEVVGLDYDALIAEAHAEAITDDAERVACPLCPRWFLDLYQRSAEDRMLRHVTGFHMPASIAPAQGWSTAVIDDSYRTAVHTFMAGLTAEQARRAIDTGERVVIMVDRHPFFATVEAETSTAGFLVKMEIITGRLKKALRSPEHLHPVPWATYLDGAPETGDSIHAAIEWWITTKAETTPEIDIPVVTLRCHHHKGIHTPHVYSHRGPLPRWFCDGATGESPAPMPAAAHLFTAPADNIEGSDCA